MAHNSIEYKDIILRAGISLDENQLDLLDLYAKLLMEWNGRVNLVSRKDEANIWPSHIIHSLSLLMKVSIPDGARIADLGSGGGLPGIPIAIALPQVSIVLIESIRKKCAALEDMIRQLGLANTKVLNARAEDCTGIGTHKDSFDLVLARAVAPLADLIKWSSSLVRRDRKMTINLRGNKPDSLRLPALIAMKGGPMEVETGEARRAGGFSYLKSIPIEFEGIEETGLVHKSLLIIGL